MAIPRPSTGEKFPLVTVPIGTAPASTVAPSRGGWRPSATRPRSRRRGPVGAFTLEGVASPEFALLPTHHPSQAGLERRDARVRARDRAAAAPPRGEGCRAPRGRPVSPRRRVRPARTPRPPRSARRTRRRPLRCTRCRPPRSRRRCQEKRVTLNRADGGGVRGDRGQPAACRGALDGDHGAPRRWCRRLRWRRAPGPCSRRWA